MKNFLTCRYIYDEEPMKKLLVIIAAALISVSLTAQNIKETDHLDDFHSLRLSGNVSVTLVPTTTNAAMHIDFGNNNPRRFAYSVRNGVLHISFSANTRSEVTRITLWYNSAIDDIRIRRADLQCTTPLHARLLNIKMTGGGKMSLCIDSDDMQLDMGNKSVAVVSGRCDFIDAKINRASAVDCRKTDCRSMTLSATESSEVYVNTTERIIVSARGNTSVFYAGTPLIVRTKISGTGSINPIEED